MSRGSSPPQLRLTERGEGEPVLLLHGLGASAHVWDPLVAQAGVGFHFISLDLPHCGQAEPWAKLTPMDVAEKLADRLGRGGSGAAWVLGHSFGGVTALQLAAIAPNLVRGVTAVAAPAMGLGPLKVVLNTSLADWTMRVASLVKPSAKAVRAYLEFIWGSGAPPTPGQIQGYLMSMEAEGHHEATLLALRSLAEFALPSEQLGASGIPLHLVFGERDRLVPPAVGSELSKALSATLWIVRGAGHCIPEERPDVLDEHLRAMHGMALQETA
ncbi:MAG: alpha/beta fold hydrolase [Myxococcaceae bacterium]